MSLKERVQQIKEDKAADKKEDEEARAAEAAIRQQETLANRRVVLEILLPEIKETLERIEEAGVFKLIGEIGDNFLFPENGAGTIIRKPFIAERLHLNPKLTPEEATNFSDRPQAVETVKISLKWHDSTHMQKGGYDHMRDQSIPDHSVRVYKEIVFSMATNSPLLSVYEASAEKDTKKSLDTRQSSSKEDLIQHVSVIIADSNLKTRE